jgi:hypothetical protein
MTTALVSATASGIEMNPDSLESLIDYLRVAVKKPEGLRLFKADPIAFTSAGIDAWHRNWAKFYTEVLEGTTEAAQLYNQSVHNLVTERLAIR